MDLASPLMNWHMYSSVSTEHDMVASSIPAALASDWPSVRLSLKLTEAPSGREAMREAQLSRSHYRSFRLLSPQWTMKRQQPHSPLKNGGSYDDEGEAHSPRRR